MRVFSRGRGMDELPEAPADELTAELTASYWAAHDERIAAVTFRTVARQLPGLQPGPGPGCAAVADRGGGRRSGAGRAAGGRGLVAIQAGAASEPPGGTAAP